MSGYGGRVSHSEQLLAFFLFTLAEIWQEGAKTQSSSFLLVSEYVIAVSLDQDFGGLSFLTSQVHTADGLSGVISRLSCKTSLWCGGTPRFYEEHKAGGNRWVRRDPPVPGACLEIHIATGKRKKVEKEAVYTRGKGKADLQQILII